MRSGALLYDRRSHYPSAAIAMRDREEVRICKRRRARQKIRQSGGEGWRVETQIVETAILARWMIYSSSGRFGPRGKKYLIREFDGSA